MDYFTIDDLAQIDRSFLQSLEEDMLIDVACKLRNFCIALVERLEQNSSNSSKPPSSDDPYAKENKGNSDTKDGDDKSSLSEDKENKTTKEEVSTESSKSDDSYRSPGSQPGSQGFWRCESPVPESTIPHYPCNCVIFGKSVDVSERSRLYTGYYTYELEKTASGIRIYCTLHHYYEGVCDCGHVTKAQPGSGYISHVEGRKKDLKLTEYTMVGPMLAAFIVALSVRFRMSRVKIKEFLSYWLSTELSVGTIDKCIRESGVACYSVVEELVKELQEQEVVNLDETPWYEKGGLKWLWMAIS